MVSQALVDKIYTQFGPYGYNPSEAAAIVFTIVFALLTIVHFIQVIWTREWFLLVVVFGALLEASANAIRIYGSLNPTVVDPYIAQQVIIVVTPVFFAAIHFTLLGRVLAIFGDKYALIKPKWIVPFFVSVDVASLIIQGVGSGKAAVAEIDSDVDNIDVGGHIVVGGLSLQLVAYLLANVVAIVFILRVKRDPPQHPDWTHRTRKYLLFTFVSALFILGRTLFRVIELAVGWIGTISTTEWTLLAFDSTFVAIAVLLLALFHPSVYLPSSRKKVSSDSIEEETKVESPSQSVSKLDAN